MTPYTFAGNFRYICRRRRHTAALALSSAGTHTDSVITIMKISRSAVIEISIAKCRLLALSVCHHFNCDTT